MLTELNNKCVKATFQAGISVFSVQSGICKVVPVCAMQGSGGSASHTHT